MCRVLLTGFMGSGKSVTGEKLAALLSVEFIDLDERVTHLAGRSIEEIFSTQGENVFRKLESKALTSLPDHSVCALGGGTLMRSENLAWALKESWLIYLRVGVKELVRRLHADQAIRPLLLDSNGARLPIEQMEIKVRNLLRQRESIYHQAHKVLDMTGVTPELAAAKCREAYLSRND